MRQFAKLVMLRLLRGYKWAISPMFPPACRYVPTCSEYAMEAVDRYGAVRGGFIAFMRLLRCHPFARGGYDPVVKVSERPHFSQTAREMGHPPHRDVSGHEQMATSASAMHGARGWMALTRLLRCNPFAHGGYDPVVKVSEKPHFSQTAREMGHPPHRDVSGHEQIATSASAMHGAI
jgi:uncharacterized protein